MKKVTMLLIFILGFILSLAFCIGISVIGGFLLQLVLNPILGYFGIKTMTTTVGACIVAVILVIKML